MHSGFAELLAALATAQTRDDTWNDEGLQEDVATLGDQRARPLPKVPPAPVHPSENHPPHAAPERPQSAAAPRSLKTASITIRLSESECAQIRQRAAEAGLTISAYLRSCTLEVEDLRAQVKQTLAGLRGLAARPPAAPAPVPPDPIHSAATPPSPTGSAFMRPTQWLLGRIRRRPPAHPLETAIPMDPLRQ